MRLGWILIAGLLLACSQQEPPASETAGQPAAWKALWEGDARVDTVGVAQLAEGDTISSHAGLTVIETTVKFPEAAANGEAFAWECYVRELQPIKLIIVRYHDRERTQFELIGESETVIPRQRGLNRFVLREPIPVARRDMYGIVMPEEETLAFRVVRNWKAMITTRPLTRPLMPRDSFATYGWRYPVRVFFRSGTEGK